MERVGVAGIWLEGWPQRPTDCPGVPSTLTFTQLQPPEDCLRPPPQWRPGHEPPGNKQGQQPADWCVLLAPQYKLLGHIYVV